MTFLKTAFVCNMLQQSELFFQKALNFCHSGQKFVVSSRTLMGKAWTTVVLL